MPDRARANEDRDWFDRIGDLGWQHVVLIVAAMVAFVVLSVATPACSLRISTTSTSTTTTTEGDR